MDSDRAELNLDWIFLSRENYRDLMFGEIAYSSRKINQKLSNIEYATQETNQKLDKLTADVNRHLTNINSELVLQSKIFANVQNILQNKRKTEAEELKKFGIFAFQNGWYEEAKEDFLESFKYNKYDYQVYFFLSKVYSNLDEPNNQIIQINKALKYGIQDVDFLQFVYMDMVSICIAKKDYDTANKLLLTSLAIKKSTASCLTSVLLDINASNITSATFDNIEFAIENYESESPARVIEAVEVISKMVNHEAQEKIKNIINKCKLKIINKYASVLYQKINNLIDLLTQISKDNQFIVNIVPQHLISKYCNNFNTINQTVSKLTTLKEKLKNVTIDSYHEVITLPMMVNYVTNKMIFYYRLVLDFHTEGSILTNPFTQKFRPDLKIALEQNEIILIQVKLNSNKYISLSTEKIIITKEHGISSIFNIDEIENLELNVINKKDSVVNIDNRNHSFDIITFILQKKDTEQILLVDKSAYYSADYGSGNKMANILNLLWSLAMCNGNILNSMKGIDSALIFTNTIAQSSIAKFSGTQNSDKTENLNVEFLSDSQDESDVEFVD